MAATNWNLDVCSKCGKPTNHRTGVCITCRTVQCRICGKPSSPNYDMALCNRHRLAYLRAVKSGRECELLQSTAELLKKNGL